MSRVVAVGSGARYTDPLQPLDAAYADAGELSTTASTEKRLLLSF